MPNSIRIKLPPERISSLKELQSLTKTQFKDISLLHLAFVHRSFANEDSDRYLSDNERLEFLGDSVLGILAAEFLYQSLPKGKEGKLAKLKSKMVSAPAIAKLARSYRFPEFLLLGRGEREKGESNTNLQADSFEAFLGALYLDQGLASCRKFLTPHFQVMEKGVDDAEETKDYKTILQEFCQKKWKKIPEYSVMKEEGPDHDKEFLVSVLCENHFQTSGDGKNKRRAEQMAAKAALRFLKIL
ncbi:ribonuclease III [Leptospira wolbachii serovar Codice str. CDC]|uniref:Ribonuclease 3 n=1 Tax=Leptospira wolbachii serovar Codice str. CDC TaxID=1218599 RepID=R9A902_9LEPT|nr:ribonuclease III [Leptospira wolbachii]EOQ98597.1 ribonuclease III [Leptospira wolbachii serovar Codice str. CDC]